MESRAGDAGRVVHRWRGLEAFAREHHGPGLVTVTIMGVYASVRGWIEIDVKQREAAEEIIGQYRHELYSGGWTFPSAPFNWTLYLFYGGDIRQDEVPWLREQVEQLAAMRPVDEDNDMPKGFFLLTAEERKGAEAWQVRDGRLDETLAPNLSWMGE
jgi:hypothetical protein